MTTFSCVTTCKDRLHHLAQTVPAMLAAGFDEVIVVDFDCPQSTAAWCAANHPGVKIVKVENRPVFSPSAARNMGAERALSKWLCFLDADVVLSGQFVSWLRKNVRQGNFYAVNYADQPRTKRRMVRNAAGLLVCEQAAFEAVDGYDEVFSGWGYEDIDILLKLRHAGYKGKALPLDLIDLVINHDNDERMRHRGTKHKRVSNLQNKFYSSAKLKLVTTFGLRTELPKTIREELYRAVTDAARKWNPDDVRSVQSIKLDVPAGIKVLPKYETHGASLSGGGASREFVVEAAFEKRLRRDIFSSLPTLLQNIRSRLWK